MPRFLKILAGAEFRLSIITLLMIAAGFLSGAQWLYLIAILIGLASLGFDSIKKIVAKQFSLDYIAILAMVVALVTNKLGTGSVVSLMILVSEALEAYGAREAEAALKHLVEKIPKACRVKREDETHNFIEKNIRDVHEGDVIFIRQQEVIPLDGYLASDAALMNEANLTGEIEPQTYRKGQLMKSGLVNAGPSLELRVTGTFATSTYQKIVNLVREAKKNPARTVRLAERYNYGFTAITLIMAGAAYALSHDPTRLLAVLVIATPCPLIIAAPVSFLGGINKASRKNIIIKRPAALETLSEITTIFFDKTGTLTLGDPTLKKIEVLPDGAKEGFSETSLLATAGDIEVHSLHPIARAIVRAKQERGLPMNTSMHVREIVGDGITGTIGAKIYRLEKSADPNAASASGGGIAIDISMEEHGRSIPIGRFILDDIIKPETKQLLAALQKKYHVAILTGDSEENAQRLFGDLGVTIHARQLPENKFAAVRNEQARGGCVMMVGDGLNDAPALAKADVGIVFSGTENSASIDAASIAILSRDASLVAHTIAIADETTRIAKQSIRWGIGLSILGMTFAFLGFIPPVTGAILQEGIDASVILNALRASR